MTAVRCSLLLGTALIAAAGCAQQPKKADYAAPATASAAAPTSGSTATPTRLSASAFPPRLLVYAYEQGWRQVVAVGNDRYFCRADIPSGSLIASHRCLSESELQTERLLVQQEQEKMMQPIPYIPKRFP
ncbi:MAG: hypothetical protein KGO22_14125 [Gammaproteobacteria bacterium]|nr:hypothetical protein [Gammaproteobacteria bacterium]